MKQLNTKTAQDWTNFVEEVQKNTALKREQAEEILINWLQPICTDAINFIDDIIKKGVYQNKQLYTVDAIPSIPEFDDIIKQKKQLYTVDGIPSTHEKGDYPFWKRHIACAAIAECYKNTPVRIGYIVLQSNHSEPEVKIPTWISWQEGFELHKDLNKIRENLDRCKHWTIVESKEYKPSQTMLDDIIQIVMENPTILDAA